MTDKVAAYKTEYNNWYITDDQVPEGWVRLTEYVEVDFQKRKTEDVVTEQLAVLDEEERQVNEKYGLALMRIKTKRQELLALESPK